LVDWATMLLINDCYYWKGKDAQLVGEWVGFLSLDFR
jgi:hypothetical protein